jgi:hypothetical protein
MAKKKTAHAKKPAQQSKQSTTVLSATSGKLNPFSWGSSFADRVTQKADKNARRVFDEKDGD